MNYGQLKQLYANKLKYIEEGLTKILEFSSLSLTEKENILKLKNINNKFITITPPTNKLHPKLPHISPPYAEKS